MGKPRNVQEQVYNGKKFASRAERRRYQELEWLEKAGEISDLRIQPRYLLQKGFKHPFAGSVRAIYYTADFAYREKEINVVEEIKGHATQAYKLRKKFFLRLYWSIDFREITKKERPDLFNDKWSI